MLSTIVVVTPRITSVNVYGIFSRSEITAVNDTISRKAAIINSILAVTSNLVTG